jgi:thiamine pyrophosphate-dependent acetolactate synthase large subunit-like protein
VRVPPGTAIIHAGVDPETIGRNSPLRVALLGDSGQVARDLADAIKSLVPAQALRARGAQTRAAAAAYTSRIRQSRLALARRASGGPVP